jgi:YjjG family noncanonical pyrimidine nucleotidase
MIKTILWDVDGTLLDFARSERYGLFACLDEIGFHAYDDEMLKRYAKINRGFWEALERGELTKQEVLTGRFRTFFDSEGIICEDVEAFNASYQEKLGSKFFENENSLELCRKLHGRFRQYVVTNGTVTAQRNKLKFSGLGDCMDGVFISDEIGIEKPGIGFFTHAFSEIEAQTGEVLRPGETLIVGDSLTSDMRGGNAAGIRCCWYNPKQLANTAGVRLDYEIRHLWDLEPILQEG